MTLEPLSEASLPENRAGGLSASQRRRGARSLFLVRTAMFAQAVVAAVGLSLRAIVGNHASWYAQHITIIVAAFLAVDGTFVFWFNARVLRPLAERRRSSGVASASGRLTVTTTGRRVTVRVGDLPLGAPGKVPQDWIGREVTAYYLPNAGPIVNLVDLTATALPTAHRDDA